MRRLAAVPGDEARRALWAEALETLPAAVAAHVLDRVVREAARRRPEAVAAYLPLLDLPALAERVGPGALAAILAAAQAEEREGCLLLLEYGGAPAARGDVGPPPDPLLESLTLGHRKTAARGPRSSVLDRVLRDPDPRVVGEVLRNPRLREGEVLAIASRRPCPEAVFWLLPRRSGWLRRPAVQRAVVQNPYAPPRLAAALCPLLRDPDLEEVANDEGLHPAVREGALLVLSWRREPAAAPEKA
jgi:FXSXX-COOH protein